MNATLTNNWIAVASADHARRGRDEMTPGFMQVCHGRQAPLKRVKPGDRVAYSAPKVSMSDPKSTCQRFVSIGIVQPGELYAFDMGGFVPFRRDVRYVPAQETSILPLLDAFEFVDDRSRWGCKFRFGLFQISDHDMKLIARAMQVETEVLHFQ